MAKKVENCQNTYDAEGNLAEYVDYVTGERELYRYRLDGSVESVTTYTLDGTSIIPSRQSAYTYDSEGRITQAAQCYLLNGSVYTANATVSYDGIGRVSGYLESGVNTAYTYLSMGMLRDQTVTSGSLSVQYHYEYEELSDDSLTGRVSGFSSAVKYGTTDKSSSGYAYTYDINGNILTISLNDVLKVSYEYDALNQLVRENNAFSNRTYTYTYDNAGNILTKKVFPYTTMVSEQLATAPAYSTYTYTYENESWGDRLTAYGGVPFTYDSLGNPLAYSNGSSYTFTWAKGRQLTNVTKGSSSFAFTYDAEGRRTSKVSYGNRTVYYVWDGDRLIGEYVPYESTYIYLYDAEGSVIGFKYNDETGYYTGGAFYTYYYEKNLQGDIVGIIDENGNKFVEYTYDAWGNMLSRTMLGSNLWSLHYNLAESNPFLYRGYYYDRETGFYYLQSRYYDPVIGRFLNADGHVNANGDLIGYNMYAYCSNNPVMYTDPTGCEYRKTLLLRGIEYFLSFVMRSPGPTAVVTLLDVAIPSKEEHYARNENNVIPSDSEMQGIINGTNTEWVAVDDSLNRYHRFTHGTQGEEAIYNKKYLFGNSEVIICDLPGDENDYIVTDPVNTGTYNYSTNSVAHAIFDVLPYYLWGNSEDDETTLFQRIVGN